MVSTRPLTSKYSSFFFFLLLLLLLFTPVEFFTPVLADGFSLGGLSDSKSPQVSRTRLRTLAVLSNAIIWIVSTRPPTSKFSRPFNNPLVIVPKAPIIIGTIVTFMFHGIFQFSSKFEVLIVPCTFLQIYSVVRRDSKVNYFANSLFFFFFFGDYYKVWSYGRDYYYYYYYYYYSKEFNWVRG